MQRSNRILISLLCSAGFCLQFLSAAYANPDGGVVTAGVAGISSVGSQLNVVQSTDKAIIDWRSFNIDAGETTRFYQPSQSSIILNRVNAVDPSHIAGTLEANGHVVIVNPNGVLFDQGSRIDVGSLTATTADISNQHFMDGALDFDKAGATDGAIRNDGIITVRDVGLVNLVAPHVENNGIIVATLGTVNLASGETFTLDLAGDGVTKLAVSKDHLQGRVVNNGRITASGGRVALTAVAARDIVDSLVSNTGVIEAKSLGAHRGHVILSAAKAAPSQSGASTVLHSGVISVDGGSDFEVGGNIELLADHVGVLNGSILSANGINGGGIILVGGDAHGQGGTPTAQMAVVQNDSLLTANALRDGNAGKVVVWADDTTLFDGNIEARAVSGENGFVETSGKQSLSVTGHVIAGEWLLDPSNVIISSAADSNIASSGGNPNIFTPTAAATLSVASIQNSLNLGTNVKVDTNVVGGGNGDITVNNSIAKTAGGNATLTLSAYRNITFAAGVGVNATAGTLDLVLNSDSAANLTGYVSLGNGSFITNGGNITIGGGANPAMGYAYGNSGSVFGVYVNGSSLNAGGGNISLRGTGYNTTTSTNYGVNILNAATIQTSGFGTIDINGVGRGTTNSSTDHGINLAGGAVVSAVNGDVTLTGTGGGAGTGASNYGVSISGANSKVRTTGGGTITITGNGGNTTSSGGANYGVNLAVANAIQSLGTGDVHVTGTGGGLSGASNYGISVTGSIVSNGGHIFLVGTGGNSSGLNNRGVVIAAGSITNQGIGNISVTGTGRGLTNSSSDYGVEVSAAGVISAMDGTVTVTGYGGGAGTGGSNYGVQITGASSTIKTTGNGSVLVTGTGGNNGGSGASNVGVNVATANGIQATGSGSITAIGTGANASGGSNYGINVGAAAASITAAGGHITLTGNGGTSSGNTNTGVRINAAAATVSTIGSGTITITGIGNGITNSANDYGVEVSSGGIVSTAGGDITIAGTGGGAGTGGTNYGVVSTGASSTIKSTGAGSIFITGNGGNLTGSGASNYGINLAAANGIQALGSGNITLTGTGGGLSGANNFGVNLLTMTANGGNINITGTGGNSSGNSNEGVRIVTSSTISTTGNGTMTIHGTGRGTGNSGSDYGIDLSTSILSTANGDIHVMGTAGGAGSGGTNYGISVSGAAATIKTTGTGHISLVGQGGNLTGSGATNVGINLGIANAVQALGSGNISITGTGGGLSGANNHGVNTLSVTANGGNIAITGTGGSSSGNSNEGVRIVSSSTIATTGSGTISVSGTGGGMTNSALNFGVDLNTSMLTTANGAIAVTGTGGGAGTGSSNYGVTITGAASSVKTTGSGAIIVTGTGGNGAGSGTSNIGVSVGVANGINATSTGTITVIGTGSNSSGGSNYGVYIPGSITGSGGAIAVTGTGGIDSGTSNVGVYLNGAGAAISNTGTGTVNVTGTGGGSGASNTNIGVDLASTSFISTVNGNLNVLGTGGGLTGSSNHGVLVNSGNNIKSTGSGNVAVSGVAGLGVTPYGVSLVGANAIQTTGGGDVTVQTNKINLTAANNINSANNLTIAPYTAGTTVGVGSGAGVLSLTNTFLGYLTWGVGKILTIGSTLAGNMAINSSFAFTKPVVFQTGSTGDITLQAALTSSNASGNSFVLASGKNFVNTAGATPINSGGGRWLVYSTSPSADSLAGMASSFRRFSCTYGGSCPTFPATGNGFLYTTTPLLTVTPSATYTLNYADLAPNLTNYAYTLSGYLGSDSGSDTIAGSVNGATTYTPTSLVGSYAVSHASGTLASAMGYGFTYASNPSGVVVVPKIITVTLTGKAGKIYDGNVIAYLKSVDYQLSGVANGDIMYLANRTGLYADPKTGRNKTVTFANLQLGGNNVFAYALSASSVTANTGYILPASGDMAAAMPEATYFTQPIEGSGPQGLEEGHVIVDIRDNLVADLDTQIAVAPEILSQYGYSDEEWKNYAQRPSRSLNAPDRQ